MCKSSFNATTLKITSWALKVSFPPIAQAFILSWGPGEYNLSKDRQLTWSCKDENLIYNSVVDIVNSVVDIVVKVVTYLKPELTQTGGASPRGRRWPGQDGPCLTACPVPL